ncbi:hypothetical protein DPMN_162871 [Dreissena polymorpha]|uniref:Uncharacterized protein n=1 Tax=Dreissena polymorpha TaxID=45954 RepID=A0A9D4EVJ4_DREPO|nr:hypothetical protein DPMN_162871 [Dreissena polymorpha]
MRGTCRGLPDSLRRCQDSLPDRQGTCKRFLYSLRRYQDYLGILDGARKSTRPAKHLQETPRRSATVTKPYRDLQETPRQTATIS